MLQQTELNSHIDDTLIAYVGDFNIHVVPYVHKTLREYPNLLYYVLSVGALVIVLNIKKLYNSRLELNILFTASWGQKLIQRMHVLKQKM